MSFTARATAFAKPWLFSFVLIIGLLAPGLASADGRPFDRIVVFGDSLSDPGNAFALSGMHHEPPYLALNPVTLIPESDMPYAVGGNRFSNGPTWVEQLGTAIGLGWSVKPAYVESKRGSSNYAVAGTRARDDVAGEVSLSEQVDRFLVRDGGAKAGQRVLYVIAIGGNDVSDALGGDAAAIAQALQAVSDAIVRLYGAGATHFLIWNVPNLGRAPGTVALDGFLGLGGALIGGAAAASDGYNGWLTVYLNGLSALPDIKIVRFDAHAVLESITTPPLKFGLQDVTNACIQPGTAAPSRCPNQDRFLFWDGIHPTRAGHAIFAFLVGKTLVHALHD
jgi:phospholipase/lecithinase/hemolysin